MRVETLGPAPRTMEIEASESERSALALRFDLVTIGNLSAKAEISRKGEMVTASGRLKASVTQSCVATGEPVAVELDEAFEIHFRPTPQDGGAEEEVELSESELDVVFYDGAEVDIGESVAETLSLSLDPFPRAPGAEEALKAAGVKAEEEAGAFAALAALRDKLKP